MTAPCLVSSNLFLNLGLLLCMSCVLAAPNAAFEEEYNPNSIVRAGPKRDPSPSSFPRNSDPENDVQAVLHRPFADVFPNVPLITPFASMESDIPARPLTPAEFNKVIVANDYVPAVENPEALEEQEGLFEGDIIVTNETQIPSKDPMGNEFMSYPGARNAIVLQDDKWPGSVIPYVIASSFSAEERGIIGVAMNQFHEKTCLRFVPRTKHQDYIHLTKGSGCSSIVGRQGGSQPVSIGAGCAYVGIVMHELMHAAGFWHEQSRQDRDHFITIYWHNIRPGMDYNFKKYTWDKIQSLSYGYDIGSIMHYGPKSFSVAGNKVTIAAVNGDSIMGQRNGFSDIDIGKLNALYECVPIPTTTTTEETSGTGNSDCKDLYNKQLCIDWANTGECEKNPEWMLENCKKSCKNCKDTCTDLHVHCPFWAGIGECEVNWGYMSLSCKYSCNLCADSNYVYEPPVFECLDEVQHCPMWAASGNCESNSAYMHVYCRKSCGTCHIFNARYKRDNDTALQSL